MSRHIEYVGRAIELAREGRLLAQRIGDAWLVAASYAVEGGARSLTVVGLAVAAELLQRAGGGYLDIGDRASAEINAWYLSQIDPRGPRRHRSSRSASCSRSWTAPVKPGVGRCHPRTRPTVVAGPTTRRRHRRRRPRRAPCRASAVRQRRLFWGAARFAIGHAAVRAGDLDTAQASLVAALDMHTTIGFDRFVMLEHTLLGETAQRQGRDADPPGITTRRSV